MNNSNAMSMNERNDHTSQLMRTSFEDVFGNYYLKLFDADPVSCTVHLSDKI